MTVRDGTTTGHHTVQDNKLLSKVGAGATMNGVREDQASPAAEVPAGIRVLTLRPTTMG